jgi:hypothetical protein
MTWLRNTVPQSSKGGITWKSTSTIFIILYLIFKGFWNRNKYLYLHFIQVWYLLFNSYWKERKVMETRGITRVRICLVNRFKLVVIILLYRIDFFGLVTHPTSTETVNEKEWYSLCGWCMLKDVVLFWLKSAARQIEQTSIYPGNIGIGTASALSSWYCHSPWRKRNTWTPLLNLFI